MSLFAGEQARDAARWAVCAALVLAAHGGFAAVMANWPDTVTAAEPDGAITIELAPLATSTTTEQNDIAPAPQEQQAEPDPTPEPVEKVEKEPEPTVVEQPQPPQPEIPPTPPQPKVEVALPPDKPKVEPKPQPKRKVVVATAPRAADRVAPRTAAPVQGAMNSNSNAMPEWKGLIAAQLQRHKNYPSGARTRREEGTALLRFTLNRQGRVVASGITRSSGFSELDQETLAVLQRAQPFPPPPSDIPGQQFPFVVPLRYYLR